MSEIPNNNSTTSSDKEFEYYNDNDTDNGNDNETNNNNNNNNNDNNNNSSNNVMTFPHFQIAWIPSTQKQQQQQQQNDKVQPLYHYYYGCLALHDIPKHTLIHTEIATLQGDYIWQAMEAYESGLHQSQQDDEEFLRDVCHLSDLERQQLWSLHDQRTTTSSTSATSSTTTTNDTTQNQQQNHQQQNQQNQHKRLIGIIYSNAFCNSDYGMEPTLFVTSATSRFNHSCRPNIGIDFHGRTIRIFTIRDVPKGQELCLCYNDVIYTHSTKVRQAYLQQYCHFTCQCIACSETCTTKRTRSDRRRRQIGILSQYLSQCVDILRSIYNEEFQDKIRAVQKEERWSYTTKNNNNSYNTNDEDEADEDEKGMYDINYDHNNNNNNNSLELFGMYLHYLYLMELEGVDHDMLEYYHLAYEFSLSFSNSSSNATTNNNTTNENNNTKNDNNGNDNDDKDNDNKINIVNNDSSASSSLSSSLSSSSSSSLAIKLSTVCKTYPRKSDIWKWDSYQWGQETFQLYLIHKGSNHTHTMEFRNKLYANGHFTKF